MTKTEIALAAIRTLTPSRETHIEALRICKALTMTSMEAAELRRAVGREWTATAPGTTRDVLAAVKEGVNRYARDVSYR